MCLLKQRCIALQINCCYGIEFRGGKEERRQYDKQKLFTLLADSGGGVFVAIVLNIFHVYIHSSWLGLCTKLQSNRQKHINNITITITWSLVFVLSAAYSLCQPGCKCIGGMNVAHNFNHVIIPLKMKPQPN